MLLRRMYSYSVAIYVYNYITQPINLIILPGKVQVQNTGISNIICRWRKTWLCGTIPYDIVILLCRQERDIQ